MKFNIDVTKVMLESFWNTCSKTSVMALVAARHATKGPRKRENPLTGNNGWKNLIMPLEAMKSHFESKL
jgi:hypothetical protein